MGIDIYNSKNSFPFLDEFSNKELDNKETSTTQLDSDSSNNDTLPKSQAFESDLVPERSLDTNHVTSAIVEVAAEEQASSDSQLVEKNSAELSSIQFNIFHAIDFHIALASNKDLATIEFIKDDEGYTLLKSDANQVLFDHLTRLQKALNSQTLSQKKKALWQALSSYSC